MNHSKTQFANEPDKLESEYRSLLVTYSLDVLLRVERLLPPPVFKVIYDFCFNTYRLLLRFRYYFKCFSPNTATRKMAKAVFRVMPYSLVRYPGLEVTYKLGQRANAEGLIGDFVECGVAQGGCAALLADVAKDAKSNRKLWLFDSYEGLPEPTAEDYKGMKTGLHVRPLPKGSCLGTVEQVSELLFEKFNYSRADIVLVKGWFQNTLPVTKNEINKISVLRLDGDWYESTKVCFENLYMKVVVGGYIILDDYISCYGCKRATDEFLSSIGKEFEIIADGRGGAYFKKTS